MNPCIVGDPAEDGNLFYEYLMRYENKVRRFLMNSGGLGEIPNPQNPRIPKRPANRPWKNGIAYVVRALFRNTATWSDYPDFGSKVLTAGVRDEHGRIFDMGRFDPRRLYDPATKDEMVSKLNRERVQHLERFPKLDPRIKEAVIQTHLL